MTAGLVDAYQALLALAEGQREALDAGDLDRFVALTEARDAAFIELQGRESQAAALDAAERAAIAEAIRLILANDEPIERRLAELKQATQAELSTLHTGLAALQTYGQPGSPDALFIDRSS